MEKPSTHPLDLPRRVLGVWGSSANATSDLNDGLPPPRWDPAADLPAAGRCTPGRQAACNNCNNNGHCSGKLSELGLGLSQKEIK